MHLARHVGPVPGAKRQPEKRAREGKVMKECQQVSMCHVMILGCGGRPRWFQLERFPPRPGRDEKAREREREREEKTRRWCLTRPCRGSVTHERLHFLSSPLPIPASGFPLFPTVSFLLSFHRIDRFFGESHGTRISNGIIYRHLTFELFPNMFCYFIRPS